MDKQNGREKNKRIKWMLENKIFEMEYRRECEKHIKGYVDDVCEVLGISWKWNMENTVFIAK